MARGLLKAPSLILRNIITTVNAHTDHLHFNVEGGIKKHEISGTPKQFHSSVAFTDASGQLTGNEAKLVVRAPNLEVAFEIIESYGRQIKDLDTEKYAVFKEAHKFTFFHTCLNSIGKEENETRQVIHYKTYIPGNSLVKTFGGKCNVCGAPGLVLSFDALYAIHAYAKDCKGKDH